MARAARTVGRGLAGAALVAIPLALMHGASLGAQTARPLTFVLLLATVASLAVVGWRWGRLAGAWLAAALALSTSVFRDALGGGDARAWLLPIAALGAAALAHGWLGTKRVLALVGAASLALAATARAPAGAGRPWLVDAAERAIATLRPAGEARTTVLGTEPWSAELAESPDLARARLIFLGLAAGIALVGFGALARRDRGARRVAALAVVSLVGHALAGWTHGLGAPGDYTFVVPILMVAVIAAAISAAAARVTSRPLARAALTVALGATYLAVYGGTG
jgi:hypothetical protein